MIDVALPADCRIVALDSIASTNDEAKTLAAAGAAPWTVVWGREQTKGRGRQGHDWASPVGNLYMSIILRPAGPATRIMQLGFATGLAVADGIAACAPALPAVALKWPNDVLLEGRKLSGILLESASEAGGSLAWLVVGIGVNVASHPDRPGLVATSLHAAGAAVEVETLLYAIVARQATWLDRWQREGFAPVRQAWLSRAANLGSDVVVRTPSGELRGRFVDLDGDGAMLLDTVEGRRVINSGDVFPAAA